MHPHFIGTQEGLFVFDSHLLVEMEHPEKEIQESHMLRNIIIRLNLVKLRLCQAYARQQSHS